MSDLAPSPPFPDPSSPLLELIVAEALELFQRDGDVGAALRHAAVHGWCEGHIEGEDDCAGCHYRGA